MGCTVQIYDDAAITQQTGLNVEPCIHRIGQHELPNASEADCTAAQMSRSVDRSL